MPGLAAAMHVTWKKLIQQMRCSTTTITLNEANNKNNGNRKKQQQQWQQYCKTTALRARELLPLPTARKPKESEPTLATAAATESKTAATTTQTKTTTATELAKKMAEKWQLYNFRPETAASRRHAQARGRAGQRSRIGSSSSSSNCEMFATTTTPLAFSAVSTGFILCHSGLFCGLKTNFRS